ncbi:cuticle collagen 39-like [Nannospalax galili]|uniref:cuticle collagen 39-like n=1 Tax=Nannospalax galili TaxID=1026970 RepID=UPI00111BE9D8|nr:cuticle collagen 39-like [Nannospalax galili]
MAPWTSDTVTHSSDANGRRSCPGGRPGPRCAWDGSRAVPPRPGKLGAGLAGHRLCRGCGAGSQAPGHPGPPGERAGGRRCAPGSGSGRQAAGRLRMQARGAARRAPAPAGSGAERGSSMPSAAWQR